MPLLTDDDLNRLAGDDNHQQVLRDIATNRQDMLQAAGNMMLMASTAEGHLDSITTDWAQQWMDLGLAFDESDERVEVVANLKNKLGYDTALLGPELKERDNAEKVEREICSLMLRREQDFTDAIINVGRDDFFGEPMDNAHRNTSLVASVAAGAYTTMRELYLSLGADVACKNVHHYRNMIRCVRSLCYLTKIGQENLQGVEERIAHLEVLKDKYDATIFTLRRQLQDFHRQAGTVGRGPNGEYQAFSAVTSTAPSLGASGVAAAAAADRHVIVIVQVENIMHLRGRHQQLYDASSNVCKNIITSFANAFDLRRTNFTETGNATKVAPVSYMFIGDEAYQALTFATELHVELNRAPDWPPPLLQMTKYSSSDAWRGLRIRVGIHYGTISEMDVPEATAVMHAEGVQVEKCMRITDLGGAGDTVVSAALWAEYKNELTKNSVPTNRRYQSLRAMKQQELPCGLRRGFKKGEVCFKLWHTYLAEREMSAIETDFEVVSFFGLEAGSKGDSTDDDPPSVEELLYAKDTELAIVQQELDALRLAVIKRDSDMEDLKGQLLSSLDQARRRTQNKVFFHECLASSLESQLLEREDALGHCEAAVRRTLRAQKVKPSPLTVIIPTEEGGELTATDGGTLPQEGDIAQCTSGGSNFDTESSGGDLAQMVQPKVVTIISTPDTLDHLDEDRRRKFKQWAAEDEAPQHLSLDDAVPSPSKGDLKHKNVTLWRQLNNLVKDAGMKVVQAVAPAETSDKHTGKNVAGSPRGQNGAVSPQGLRRIQSAIRQGSLPHVARLHSIIRVFTMLTKRFIANEDMTNDSDNQSISEEQFIFLFMKLIHPEGVAGSQREYIQLMANSAVDNETVEAANQNDDSRLIRSGVGHLARIFLWLRQFKRKSLLEANTLKKMTEEASNREKKEKKKGGGGGPDSTVVNTAASKLLSTSAGKPGGRRTPSVTPSTSPQTSVLEVPNLTPRPNSDNAADVGRLKDEVQMLRSEINKLKAQQRLSQQSVAASKIARAKAEDIKVNCAPFAPSGPPNELSGGQQSEPVGGAAVSPATQSLVEEAVALVANETQPMHHSDEGMFTLDDASSSPFTFKPRAACAHDAVLSPTSQDGDGGSEEHMLTEDPEEPALHPANDCMGTEQRYQPMPRGPTGVASHESSPLRVSSSSVASKTSGLGLTGHSISSPAPHHMVAAAESKHSAALASAKAHRLGTPFSADRNLRVGGSGIASVTQQAGLYVTDQGLVQLGGFDSLQQHRPPKGPVLHPLRRNLQGMAAIAPPRSATPPPLAGVPQGQSTLPKSNEPPLALASEAVRNKGVTLPAGMSAPHEQPVPQGKLYFALNAQDVQRQMQQDVEERRRLEEHQHRIQEQLVHLRQLQSENEALMAAANRSTVGSRKAGRPPSQQGGSASPPPIGITRLVSTANYSIGSAVASPKVKVGAAPSLVVNSVASPAHHQSALTLDGPLTDAAAITVPSAVSGQKIANIVAQHRQTR